MQVGEYRLNNPHDIETPEFLVYEDMVGFNIDAVIRVCGSVDRIVPHAKTHKSAAVLERQMDAGMRSYKCATLREAELLVEHGVDELIFAYPARPAEEDRAAGCGSRRTTPEPPSRPSSARQSTWKASRR